MFRTDWFRSHIQVRDGHILSLEPSNMPARRVRVIERKSRNAGVISYRMSRPT